MPVFNYKIIVNGKSESGEISAVNMSAAGSQLRGKGGIIIELEEKALQSQRKTTTKKSVKSKQFYFNPFIRSIHIEQAFEQLAVMLEEGVPIVSALSILTRTSTKSIGSAMHEIARSIEKGSTVSEAIVTEAPFVGPVTRALVKVGESNGSLPEMLAFSAELMARKREVKSLIIEALIYPTFVMVATVCVGIFMSNYVLPKLVTFISTRSAELPAITRLLVDVNEFALNYGVHTIISVVLTAILFALLHSSTTYGVYTSRYLLNIPFIGKALTAYSNSLWCHTLGMLVKSGINITNCLKLTENTMSNKYFREQFEKIQIMINEGQTLGISFMATSLNDLSPIACSMIVVGENSGSLDRGLIHAAEYNQKELTRRVRLVGRMIEPVMLLIVGGIVAFVYLAFFMAIQSATLSVH